MPPRSKDATPSKLDLFLPVVPLQQAGSPSPRRSSDASRRRRRPKKAPAPRPARSVPPQPVPRLVQTARPHRGPKRDGALFDPRDVMRLFENYPPRQGVPEEDSLDDMFLDGTAMSSHRPFTARATCSLAGTARATGRVKPPQTPRRWHPRDAFPVFPAQVAGDFPPPAGSNVPAIPPLLLTADLAGAKPKRRKRRRRRAATALGTSHRHEEALQPSVDHWPLPVDSEMSQSVSVNAELSKLFAEKLQRYHETMTQRLTDVERDWIRKVQVVEQQAFDAEVRADEEMRELRLKLKDSRESTAVAEAILSQAEERCRELEAGKTEAEQRVSLLEESCRANTKNMNALKKRIAELTSGEPVSEEEAEVEDPLVQKLVDAEARVKELETRVDELEHVHSHNEQLQRDHEQKDDLITKLRSGDMSADDFLSLGKRFSLENLAKGLYIFTVLQDVLHTDLCCTRCHELLGKESMHILACGCNCCAECLPNDDRCMMCNTTVGPDSAIASHCLSSLLGRSEFTAAMSRRIRVEVDALLSVLGRDHVVGKSLTRFFGR